MKKLLYIPILFLALYGKAQEVSISQPYNFLRYIKVRDSVRASIYFQNANDTLATRAYARGFAGGGLVAGVGIRVSGDTVVIDTANYRKMDSLYVVTDSTGIFKINGRAYAFKMRGAVFSFNGRIGAVQPADNDYAQYYPKLDSTYNDPAFINTVNFSKMTGLPKSLAGYNILDAVKNGGNASQIVVDVEANKPPTPTLGTFFFGTDDSTLSYYNGSRYIGVASASSIPDTIFKFSYGLTPTRSGNTVTVKVDTTTLKAVFGSSSGGIFQLYTKYGAVIAGTDTVSVDTTIFLRFSDTTRGIASKNYVLTRGFLTTETDPVAVVKQITNNQGSGILITGTAAQTLGSNPVWLYKVDTSLIATLTAVKDTAAVLRTLIASAPSGITQLFSKYGLLITGTDTATVDTTLFTRFKDTATLATKYFATHQGYLTTETDPIALAKTIVINQGSGISITGLASQALSTTPTWTFKADTSLLATLTAVKDTAAVLRAGSMKYTDSAAVYQTKYRSDTGRVNVYTALGAKVAYTDSGTIYQTKYRSDTGRTNVYGALAGKVSYGDSSSIYYTKFRSDTSRVNIYAAIAASIAGGVRYSDSSGTYYSKYRSDTSRANIYVSLGLKATQIGLADTAAVLRALIPNPFDSAGSQGGGFHTRPYNDIRYTVRTTIANVFTTSFSSVYTLYTIDKFKEGSWAADTADHSSTTDTGMILVDAGGLRWKRITNGMVDIRVYGVDTLSSDITAAATRALAISNRYYILPAGNYKQKSKIWIGGSNVVLKGEGDPSNISNSNYLAVNFEPRPNVSGIVLEDFSLLNGTLNGSSGFDTSRAGVIMIAPDTGFSGARGFYDTAIYLNNLTISTPTSGFNGMSIYTGAGNNVSHISVTNSRFKNIGRMGIESTGVKDTVWIRDIFINHNLFQTLGYRSLHGIAVSLGSKTGGAYVGSNTIVDPFGIGTEIYDCQGCKLVYNTYSQGMRTGTAPWSFNSISSSFPGRDNVAIGNVVLDSFAVGPYFKYQRNLVSTGNKSVSTSYSILNDVRDSKFTDDVYKSDATQNFVIDSSTGNGFTRVHWDNSLASGFTTVVIANDSLVQFNTWTACFFEGPGTGHMFSETKPGLQGNIINGYHIKGLGGSEVNYKFSPTFNNTQALLSLGGFNIWFDSLNVPRFKNGVPAYSTDGTSFGTGGGGGSQTLTSTQLALKYTMAISGGNSQDILPATDVLAGLLDSLRANFLDSLITQKKLYHITGRANGRSGDSTMVTFRDSSALVATIWDSLGIAHASNPDGSKTWYDILTANSGSLLRTGNNFTLKNDVSSSPATNSWYGFDGSNVLGYHPFTGFPARTLTTPGLMTPGDLARLDSSYLFSNAPVTGLGSGWLIDTLAYAHLDTQFIKPYAVKAGFGFIIGDSTIQNMMAHKFILDTAGIRSWVASVSSGGTDSGIAVKNGILASRAGTTVTLQSDSSAYATLGRVQKKIDSLGGLIVGGSDSGIAVSNGILAARAGTTVSLQVDSSIYGTRGRIQKGIDSLGALISGGGSTPGGSDSTVQYDSASHFQGNNLYYYGRLGHQLGFGSPAITATSNDFNGLLLYNPTLAVSGTQQNSSSLIQRGQGFGTTAGTSQNVEFFTNVAPVQGTTPAGSLQWWSKMGSASAFFAAQLDQSGNFTAKGGLASVNAISSGTDYTFTGSSKAGIWGSDSIVTVSLRQGTFATDLRIYNSYTSGSVGNMMELGSLRHPGLATIETYAPGGTADPIYIIAPNLLLKTSMLPTSTSSSDSVLVVTTAASGADTVKKIAQSALAGSVSDGAYTPTLTNTTNISASSLNLARYIVVGSTVICTVTGTFTATTASTGSVLTISLPFTATTTVNYVIGSGTADANVTSPSAAIVNLTSSTTAGLYFVPTFNTGSSFSCTFTFAK